MSEAGESFDAGEIKAKPGGTYLHSEASFRLRFSPQRAVIGPGIRPAINFTGDAELFIQAEDSSRAICKHIVLRKQLRRRGQNCNSKIPESIEAAIATDLLADPYALV